jgi:vitamin B12 transporter
MQIRFMPTAGAVALWLALPYAHALSIDEGAVVVTATRTPTRTNDVLADVTVIDRPEIEAVGAATLPQLLSMQPGVQIAPQGGMGKVSDIFVRGTNTGHTLLLVDGIPLGSATLGSPSLVNFPLQQVERIEILRGPASGLYGSDAIGGVIQVFTKKGSGPAQPELFLGYGSYGTSQLTAGISGGSEGWSYNLRLADMRSRGFNLASDPARYQQVTSALPNPDADGYRNISWSGQLNYKFMPGHEAGISLQTVDVRNSFDSAGDPTLDAYNKDKVQAWSVYTRNRLTSGWTSTLRYGQSQDRNRNWDFDWNIFAPAWSHFTTKQAQWSWLNDVVLPVGKLLLGVERLNQNVDSTTSYSVKQRTVESVLAGWQGQLGSHSWQLSQRVDDNSQFGSKTTGGLSYGYRLNEDWLAKAAYGTGYKAPTFNQLYYTHPMWGNGNPNLLPETSTNREIGVVWQQVMTRVSLIHYDNRIRNLISGWPPVNVGRARITGDELTLDDTRGAWTTTAAIDWLKPINSDTGERLQRRAAQMLKGKVIYSPGNWNAGAELNYVGARYDTATQTRPLAAYDVVNLFGSYRINREFALEGRLDNLFDKAYETAWGYANPRASVFVGLRYAPK